jgi:hypothetical protein
MNLHLSHFTDEPLHAVRSVEQKFEREDYRSCFDKPKGLWVSVDGSDDWASWCESESFGLGKLRYSVVLVNDPRVLILDGESALYNFTDNYGKDVPQHWSRERYIDWSMVARDYRGIIIAPYIWSCRMGDYTRWYYGWDCASGCIWSADAVASVSESQRSEAA